MNTNTQSVAKGFLRSILLGCLEAKAFTMASKSNAMFLWTYKRMSALRRFCSILLLSLVFTYFNVELPLSTVAAVTGTTNSSCNTVKMLGYALLFTSSRVPLRPLGTGVEQ